MSTPAKKTARRIWSDPYFYAAMGVVGGTYVLLIVAMLAADAAYIFTSDLGEPVTIDFSSTPDGQRLKTGDVIAEQFASYGLSVTTGKADHPAVVIDSGRPAAANSALGTPNADFGGPGMGQGGRDAIGGESNPGKNSMPLGNVVVVSASPPPFPPSQMSEIVVSWHTPMEVEAVWIVDPSRAGGTIEAWDEQGHRLLRRTISAKGQVGRKRIPIGLPGVTRMVLTLPAGTGLAELVYSGRNRARMQLGGAQARTLKQGHIRVVPPGTPRIEPARHGRLLLRWQDPVRLNKLTLLNVCRPGGWVRLFDLSGRQLVAMRLKDLGENSSQSVEFAAPDPRTGQMRTGQPDVAELQIDLPCGAALADLDFWWSGRVRSAWERRVPAAARLLHNPITAALSKGEIQYSIKLSLIACSITTILSLWVAIPIGYLLSRHQFPGRNWLDAVLDIPIVLPPLVVGLSLLILFQFAPRSLREAVVYQIPAVVLAQFAVACAFAVRTMRATFDQIDARREQVALTLGCSRFQAFGMVVLPEAGRGILTAGTLAWARSLGEFGPLLIFAGATRNKTEVLSTTVFLELSIGDLGAAVAVSLIMVVAAVIVLVIARLWGTRSLTI